MTANSQGFRYYPNAIDQYPCYDKNYYPSKREKEPTKSKWSISNFFRRKKDKDKDSSSSEDNNNSTGKFLHRKKHRTKPPAVTAAGGFDYVVQQKTLQYPKVENSPKKSVSDASHRKSRRDSVKARVEARRDYLKTESSSENEESATSSLTSSWSNVNGTRSRDSSASRKSRSARTERYLNRRSSRESLNNVPVGHYYYSPPPKPEPPPPPPRDPQRKLIISQSGDSGRPISYSFEAGSTTSIHSYKSDCYPNQFRSNSVNSEPIRRYIRRHPNVEDKYNYFADHAPRSRKPIMIQATSNLAENKYLSDSQIVTGQPRRYRENQTFRVQVTKEEGGLVSKMSLKSRLAPETIEPKINGNNMRRLTPPPTKSVAKKEPAIDSSRKLSQNNTSPNEEVTERRRSSTNLEDALNELEAIYNSLRLGDEDLLERAEQQEKKQLCGSMSDSNSHLEMPRRQKSDDMAERKWQQSPVPAVAELEKGLSQISYLLASPVYNSIDSFCATPKADEPDVTLDDVVFRNIKHINNTLKVVDPQPPFGIPLGPISSASHSDYLHAQPQTEPVKCKRTNIPDLVKDDLAYRSLRKDLDYLNNNTNNLNKLAMENIWVPKAPKKRAVRSLSANIYNLLSNQEEKRNPSPSPVLGKPPSGRRATPSPIPLTEKLDYAEKPDKQQEKSEQQETQEHLIAAVAEHAKLCEKLLECVIESTELIKPHKAVTEFVQDDENLAELEAEKAPTSETATAVETVQQQQEERQDSEHDYENIDNDTATEDESASKKDADLEEDEDEETCKEEDVADGVDRETQEDTTHVGEEAACERKTSPRSQLEPLISVCTQTACDLYRNVDIVALIGFILAIASVIACFVNIELH